MGLNKEQKMRDKTEIVVDYFKKLCQIPRPSGHEEHVRNYLRDWAESAGYKTEADEAGNLIVECGPCRGYESKSKVALQAHMDMVCVAETGKQYHPRTEPIQLVQEGDYLRADGTSLGGDDGIGIAIAQYMAQYCADRGELRLIFTADEEKTTTGAKGLKAEYLELPYLINLDSEVSDKVMVSSAGCLELTGSLELEQRPASFKQGFQINIEGLTGGHSGDDIEKGRVNGILLGAELLAGMREIGSQWECCGFEGGSASNAIPPGAVIRGNTGAFKELHDIVVELAETFQKKHRQEAQLKITFEECAPSETAIDIKPMIDFLCEIPNGVIDWSETIEGLVGTSSNIGVFRTNGEKASYAALVRGEQESNIIHVAEEIRKKAVKCGFDCVEDELIPSWPADSGSLLLQKTQEAYAEVTGDFLEPIAVHAVLECAEFRRKNSSLQMVSISPDVYDAHSTRERLYLPSVEKVVLVLESLLKKI